MTTNTAPPACTMNRPKPSTEPSSTISSGRVAEQGRRTAARNVSRSRFAAVCALADVEEREQVDRPCRANGDDATASDHPLPVVSGPKLSARASARHPERREPERDRAERAHVRRSPGCGGRVGERRADEAPERHVARPCTRRPRSRSRRRSRPAAPARRCRARVNSSAVSTATGAAENRMYGRSLPQRVRVMSMRLPTIGSRIASTILATVMIVGDDRHARRC